MKKKSKKPDACLWCGRLPTPASPLQTHRKGNIHVKLCVFCDDLRKVQSRRKVKGVA